MKTTIRVIGFVLAILAVSTLAAPTVISNVFRLHVQDGSTFPSPVSVKGGLLFEGDAGYPYYSNGIAWVSLAPSSGGSSDGGSLIPGNGIGTTAYRDGGSTFSIDCVTANTGVPSGCVTNGTQSYDGTKIFNTGTVFLGQIQALDIFPRDSIGPLQLLGTGKPGSGPIFGTSNMVKVTTINGVFYQDSSRFLTFEESPVDSIGNPEDGGVMLAIGARGSIIWQGKVPFAKQPVCDSTPAQNGGARFAMNEANELDGGVEKLVYCDGTQYEEVVTTPFTDDTIPVANGLKYEGKTIPNCVNPGDVLQYDATTNTFDCAAGGGAVRKVVTSWYINDIPVNGTIYGGDVLPSDQTTTISFIKGRVRTAGTGGADSLWDIVNGANICECAVPCGTAVGTFSAICSGTCTLTGGSSLQFRHVGGCTVEPDFQGLIQVEGTGL